MQRPHFLDIYDVIGGNSINAVTGSVTPAVSRARDKHHLLQLDWAEGVPSSAGDMQKYGGKENRTWWTRISSAVRMESLNMYLINLRVYIHTQDQLLKEART